MVNAMQPRRLDTPGIIGAANGPRLVIPQHAAKPAPVSGGMLRPMEERHPPPPPPLRGEHSFAVYAAIIGQKPAICPLEEGTNGSARSPHGIWRLTAPHWATLQRMMKRMPFSPNLRTGIKPLFDRAKKCWGEARARLMHRSPPE